MVLLLHHLTCRIVYPELSQIMIMRLPLLLFCLLLSACGQKGDLYLPESPAGDDNETQAEDTDKLEHEKSN